MIAGISRYFPIVLVIFHIIGLYLFIQSEKASDLTWMNLTLCGTLIFLSEIDYRRAALIFLIIFSGGFLIELIGVHTGYLFGDYAYNDVLGIKLLGVSLIIGVNWYAIVVASANLARLVRTGPIVQALISGLLCVVMDVVIEPVAIKYGFWIWHSEEVPLFNYTTWFIFAAIFSFLYLKNSLILNKTAVWLYGIWFLFFITLIFI